MALNKYKICPSCGMHNAPNRLECDQCETDLTRVRVVDKDYEEKSTALQTVTEESSSDQLFRICDCGAKNSPQARKCTSCGEDISDILPSNSATTEAFSYTLLAVPTGEAFCIDTPAIVVGREAQLKDHLSAKPFVSRQHARLSIIAGKVLIENLSATNKTFVNNSPINDAEPTTLQDGDEIGFGGKVINGTRQEGAAYFIFKVNS